MSGRWTKKGGGGGAAAAPVPQVTPLHAGVLAAWLLDEPVGGSDGRGNDRSGNSHPLFPMNTNITNFPSFTRPYPAQCSIWPGAQGGGITSECLTLGLADMTPDLTVTCKATFKNVGADQGIILCAASFPAAFQSVLYVSSAGLLSVNWTGQATQSHPTLLESGIKYFFSMQRDGSDNSVRFGVNGVYSSTGPLAAPPLVGGLLRVGGWNGGDGVVATWCSCLEDIVVTQGRLSDAVVEADRRIAMGV